jgi:hypothetical protein
MCAPTASSVTTNSSFTFSYGVKEHCFCLSVVTNPNGEYRDRLLVSHEGIIYDMTEFADHHPGGRDLLMTSAGLDLGHFFYNLSIGRLVGWSVGRLVGWSVGRLIGWSVGRLVGWWVGGSVGRWENGQIPQNTLCGKRLLFCGFIPLILLVYDDTGLSPRVNPIILPK